MFPQCLLFNSFDISWSVFQRKEVDDLWSPQPLVCNLHVKTFKVVTVFKILKDKCLQWLALSLYSLICLKSWSDDAQLLLSISLHFNCVVYVIWVLGLHVNIIHSSSFNIFNVLFYLYFPDKFFVFYMIFSLFFLQRFLYSVWLRTVVWFVEEGKWKCLPWK